MVLMPLVGAVTALGLRAMHYPIDDKTSASFYLVVMMVTCTPTANTCMVMAELAGENKEAMGAAIFYQYLFAPVLLTASVTAFVALAAEW